MTSMKCENLREMYFTITVLQTRRDHIQQACPLVSMDIALTGKLSGTNPLQWMSSLKSHGQGQAQPVYVYMLEVQEVMVVHNIECSAWMVCLVGCGMWVGMLVHCRFWMMCLV